MSAIGYLQKAGHWNYNLGNPVPLAIANLFQTKVTIISSRPAMEIVTIQPSLQDETHPQYNIGTTLQYAYILLQLTESTTIHVLQQPLELLSCQC